MTRPKIGWVDPLALTEDYKKTLRDGAKKVPAAERAKVCAVTEHAIEYRENVKGAPDRVWEQPVIPFWDAYRAMTDGKYSYLFRELGDLSTEPLTHEVDTATDVVEVIENAMQVFQNHINRKWKEH